MAHDAQRGNTLPAAAAPATRPTGALPENVDAAMRLRADHLEAAYRLAAKRGETLEAMLAAAEARNRELARALAQAQDEVRATRTTAARRESEIAVARTGEADDWRAAAGHDVPPAALLPEWLTACLAALRGKLEAVGQQALRERSPATRDLLAWIASNGHLDAEALLDLARSALRFPELLPPARLRAAFNADAVARLASVIGNQNLGPGDGPAATELYRFVLAGFGQGAMSDADKIFFVDLLTRAGALEEARSSLERFRLSGNIPVDHACLLANMLHPGIVGAEGLPRWLAALNAMFSPYGLEEVRIAEGPSPMLHRIECPLNGAVAMDGPLVSVLMTTFEPDATVATALRSVLEQSWRNLELIIVDDASSEQSYAVLRELAQADPRVVLLRNDRNQGTYASKNRGLSIARGEFVTCHDSDDWSHPRKIERQVAPLIGGSAAAGNLSFWVRTTAELVFRRFSADGSISYHNTSSLMFRRQPVLERCGYYDSVRTGADTEYYKRIEAVFGRKLPRYSAFPLSFGQIRDGSLTASGSGGMSNGWISPPRRAYRGAWRHWHQSVARTGGVPYLPAQITRRPFPAPPPLLPERASGGRAAVYDAVIVGDFRESQSGSAPPADEIGAAAAAGKRIAICQVDSWRGDLIYREFLDARMQELLHSGLAEQIELDAVAQTRLVLVRDPAVLQFLAAPRSGIEARQLRIAAPSAPAPHGLAYDIDTCTRNAERVFGGSARWIPAGPLARAIADAAADPARDGQA